MIRGTTVLGVGSSAEPLLEKREKGRTPSYFRYCQKPPRYIPLLNWPTRQCANLATTMQSGHTERRIRCNFRVTISMLITT